MLTFLFPNSFKLFKYSHFFILNIFLYIFINADNSLTSEKCQSQKNSQTNDQINDKPAINFVETADDSPPSSAINIQAGTLWPLPQKFHYGEHNRTVGRQGLAPLIFMNSTFEEENKECDILEKAKNLYLNRLLVFPALEEVRGGKGTPLQLVIKVKNRCPGRQQFPPSDMNEEYRLMVPLNGEILLEANEIWGVLRGIETFSQLFFVQQGQLYIRTITVHDWPEYSVRGILLDTSRHYLNKNIILRQIDLASQNKMNVLHWHIVDMESFPYVSTHFPNISKEGAFSSKHIYSPNVVNEIIQHARLRGVRVVPEFDTPGHMASWIGSGILADCYDKKNKLVTPSMLDPSKESTYIFLKEFLKEIDETFRDKYIHLGGDETAYWTIQCWSRNPKIREFMAEKGFTNITQLENYYFSRLQAIVKEVFGTQVGGRKMIFWQEVFDNNKPDVSAIVHNWYSQNDEARARDVKRAVQQGFQVIVSSCWYLNLINYGADWRALSPKGLGKYYYCDPRNFPGTYEQKQLVIGGIATMWGEYIDGTNLESTLWPRASAVAERLWSPPNKTKSADEAWPRLQEHRCRMISRGYRAEPEIGRAHV